MALSFTVTIEHSVTPSPPCIFPVSWGTRAFLLTLLGSRWGPSPLKDLLSAAVMPFLRSLAPLTTRKWRLSTASWRMWCWSQPLQFILLNSSVISWPWRFWGALRCLCLFVHLYKQCAVVFMFEDGVGGPSFQCSGLDKVCVESESLLLWSLWGGSASTQNQSPLC